ncbi:MAG: undecaprenyldiphospho-muramoylpentapeptide beta-N-acetylglucosaminyltransferase [Bacteroidales bacterium]|nr:undecaprenyldiphospho-muramoylpentapeptide beta-N-acetylglucosaminyltransferase [Bacteroidales bacterium]
MRVIISGGGTGGHIFPAISIAGALKEIDKTIDILFVGAEGKMEMEKVPAAGYKIVGLPVAGFHRQFNFKNVCRNLLFPFKLVMSLWKASRIIKDFRPDVAVGVGGYASGPLLQRAAVRSIPCLIQEQNSFPGVTNRILAAKSAKICVAYPNMERFFDKEKIILTGNPVRQSLTAEIDREESAAAFGLRADKPVILVIGGSLGARSINEGILKSIGEIDGTVQLIWQTGKIYKEDIDKALGDRSREGLVVTDFIKDMDKAYSLADIVISRAGASSISELAMLGKASILVPSPNVSEDHQTKNARALESQGAAILVKDDETDTLIARAKEVLGDEGRLKSLRQQVLTFARPNAARDIAREVIALAKHREADR